MYACRYGHKDVVKSLLDYSDSNIDLNARNNVGLTAFMFACRFEHKDVVQLLLEHQEVVDINIPESFQLSEEIKNMISIFHIIHSMTLQK